MNDATNEAAVGAEPANSALWTAIFETGEPRLKAMQAFHAKVPSSPRCRLCYSPFGGVGGLYYRMRGRGPALRNPYFCNACDQFIAAYPGGAEVTLSMVFVDVRRSTQTASSMSATAFHDYLRGFFNATHRALFETDGFVTEFRGDCAVGSYPPAMSGPDHAAKAVRAAQILLGDGAPRSRDGDDVPIGIGVHTGRVFIGTISDLADANKQNVSILGDNANIAALLAQSAAAGEALLSVETLQAAGRPVDPGSLASLELKGRPRPQAAVRMMAS